MLVCSFRSNDLNWIVKMEIANFWWPKFYFICSFTIDIWACFFTSTCSREVYAKPKCIETHRHRRLTHHLWITLYYGNSCDRSLYTFSNCSFPAESRNSFVLNVKVASAKLNYFSLSPKNLTTSGCSCYYSKKNCDFVYKPEKLRGFTKNFSKILALSNLMNQINNTEGQWIFF